MNEDNQSEKQLEKSIEETFNYESKHELASLVKEQMNLYREKKKYIGKFLKPIYEDSAENNVSLQVIKEMRKNLKKMLKMKVIKKVALG